MAVYEPYNNCLDRQHRMMREEAERRRRAQETWDEDSVMKDVTPEPLAIKEIKDD